MLDAILRQNVIQHRLFDGDVSSLRLLPEDHRIRFRRRRLDARAITHAAQERLVGEILLLEVRREHDELLERNFDLLSGVQREIIDAALEWHDPAIQKILRRYALAAKVVDHE